MKLLLKGPAKPNLGKCGRDRRFKIYSLFLPLCVIYHFRDYDNDSKDTAQTGLRVSTEKTKYMKVTRPEMRSNSIDKIKQLISYR